MVLLDPARGANVGAACRAAKNMGAAGLAVVGGSFDPDEARRTAVHADDVFDARRKPASLDEAVAGSALVIGTTSRRQPWAIPVRDVGEAFADARARGLAGGDVALVFGPEDSGLDNATLARCHMVACIPTADEYASLNLAQAVVVCLYEWLRGSREQSGVPSHPEHDPPADAATQAAALADLSGVLAEVGFLEGDQGERVMASVASMLVRGGLSARDASILRGIARQVRWAVRRGR